jgi:hypothetical protein
VADDRYYGDQPRFQRKDPLDRWAWIFLGIAAVALVWFLVIIWLVGTNRLAEGTLFGRSETFWVGISTLFVIVALLGLIFVIVGRLGAAGGGSYLSTDLQQGRPRNGPRYVAPTDQRPMETQPAPPPVDTEPRPVVTEERPAARIDDPFGPDGRMLLSYSVPEQQPRGIYGDTWVPIDRDAVLNVKSRLAKTSGGNRP